MTTDLRQLWDEAHAIQRLLSGVPRDVADAIERALGRLLAYGACKDAEVRLLRYEMEQLRHERWWRPYMRSAQ